MSAGHVDWCFTAVLPIAPITRQYFYDKDDDNDNEKDYDDQNDDGQSSSCGYQSAVVILCKRKRKIFKSKQGLDPTSIFFQMFIVISQI